MSPEELLLLVSKEDINALNNLIFLIVITLILLLSLGWCFRQCLKSLTGTKWKKKLFELDRVKTFYWTNNNNNSNNNKKIN